MCDPANGSTNGKDHREHGCRNTQCFQNNAGVKVDVGVELLIYEILVFERDFFESFGDFEVLVFDAQLSQHLVRCLFHDLGSGIKVLVDPMSESHQAERIVFVFCLRNVFIDSVYCADLFEHFYYGFIGTPVRGTPECCDPRCNTGKGVGLRGAREAYGRG